MQGSLFFENTPHRETKGKTHHFGTGGLEPLLVLMPFALGCSIRQLRKWGSLGVQSLTTRLAPLSGGLVSGL